MIINHNFIRSLRAHKHAWKKRTPKRYNSNGCTKARCNYEDNMSDISVPSADTQMVLALGCRVPWLALFYHPQTTSHLTVWHISTYRSSSITLPHTHHHTHICRVISPKCTDKRKVMLCKHDTFHNSVLCCCRYLLHLSHL